MKQKLQQQPSCGYDTNLFVPFALYCLNQDIGKMRASAFAIITLKFMFSRWCARTSSLHYSPPRTQLAVFVETYIHYRPHSNIYCVLVSYLLIGLCCSVSETSFLHNWLVQLLFLWTFAEDCISPGCYWRALNGIMLKIYLCGNH